VKFFPPQFCADIQFFKYSISIVLLLVLLPSLSLTVKVKQHLTLDDLCLDQWPLLHYMIVLDLLWPCFDSSLWEPDGKSKSCILFDLRENGFKIPPETVLEIQHLKINTALKEKYQ